MTWTLKIRPKQSAKIDLDNRPNRVEISPVDPNDFVMQGFVQWFMAGVMNIFVKKPKITIILECEEQEEDDADG